MQKHNSPLWANMKSFRTYLIAFLILLLHTILITEARASSKYPNGYSVKTLDLSRPLDVEDLMAAGQLGGSLYPTRDMTNSSGNASINASFGEAIQTWNRHEYPSAVELFKRHLALYPDSPWAAEAVLHIGCDCMYHGRYAEAERSFQTIIASNQGNPYPGAQMMVHKARVRLANLRTAQGNFAEAMEQFAILKQSSPDWRHRTYAASWIQRLSLEQLRQSAILNCGFRALAYLLEKKGKKADADKLLSMPAASPRGQSLNELKSIATGYGYRLTGLRLSASQLKQIPLPAIVQVNGLTQGDLGHYWILEKRTENTLKFYDPQSRRRFTQTTSEFSQEWAGSALVFAGKKKLPGIVLAAKEMENLYGGCCGLPASEPSPGPPCGPGGPGGPEEDCSPPSCGAPTWSVNRATLNFFVKDTPLWYRSPIGPPMEITLSYSSQSAIANYEPFGNKWQFNYATYLVEDTGGNVTVFMPDGRRDAYTPDGLGGYTAPPAVYNLLIKSSPTHYEVWFPDDSVYVYDIPAGSGSQQPFLVEMRDAHGLSLSFGYDANVHLTTITDAMGRVNTLTYNTTGQVITVTDPFGRQATFDYDANSNLINITDMGGYWSSFTYGQDNYITGLANARGAWTFYTEPADGIYNGNPTYPAGNPYPAPGATMYVNYRLTITNPRGYKEEYYYCGIGYSWHVTPMDYVNYVDTENSNFNAPKVKYSFITTTNGNRPKIRYMYPLAAPVRTFSYDAVGNCTQSNDGWTNWPYTYNVMGKVTSIRNPYLKVTTMTYAANNVDLISVTDDLTNKTTAYNSTHDVISTTDNLGTPRTTSYVYNGYGQVTSVTDALGIVNNYLYDNSHRLVTITRDGQTLHQYTYDALDRIRTHTDPSGLTLTYDYNDLDQVTRITYPDTRFKTYQYSTCCPRIVDSVTERSGQTTFYSYDQMNHLISITDPAGGVTGFSYDPNGNQASIVDPKGNTTGFTYDSYNHLVQKTYADGTFESFTYTNSVNLVKSRTDARGVTTNYQYTPLRQLTNSHENNGPYTYYFYDNFGRKKNDITPENWGYNYYYDANSRLNKVAGTWYTLNYQYDALDRRTAMTWDKGQAVSYAYDTLNRLTSLTVGGQVYTYGYAGASPLVQSLTRPDGSVTAYQYDNLNRLTQMTTTVSGVTISQYAYTYNAQDLRDREVAGDPSPGYADYLANYAYNNVNKITQLTDPGDKTPAYDAAGNLTGGYTPAGYPFTAAYDGSNHLTSLSYTDAGGVVNQMEYHYLGAILTKKKLYRNGAVAGETRYVYDGSQVVQERDANKNLVNEYTWGLGLPGGIGGLLDLQQGGASGPQYSYLFDGKGNVTGLLDGVGQVAQTYQYDPFGAPQGASGSVSQPMQFSTKPYDDQTGLSYYGYRFYNPALGRWMTRDPLGEKGGINPYGFVDSVGKPFSGTNLYAFCDNDPVNKIDPNGLYSLCHFGCDLLYGVTLNLCRMGYTTCALSCPAICAPTGPLAGACLIACEIGCSIGLNICNTYAGKAHDDCYRECDKKKCPQKQ